MSARRTPRCAARDASVRTSTTTLTPPRSEVVRAGTPTRQLVESASTRTSALSRSRCSASRLGSVGDPISSSPSMRTAIDTPGSCAECTHRRAVHRDPGLVVGRAPPVEPTVALDRLERLAVPRREVSDRLHVVMGVQQHRGGTGSAGPKADHGRKPAVGARDRRRRSSPASPSCRATSSALACRCGRADGSAETDGMRTSRSRSARTVGRTDATASRTCCAVRVIRRAAASRQRTVRSSRSPAAARDAGPSGCRRRWCWRASRAGGHRPEAGRRAPRPTRTPPSARPSP